MAGRARRVADLCFTAIHGLDLVSYIGMYDGCSCSGAADTEPRLRSDGADDNADEGGDDDESEAAEGRPCKIRRLDRHGEVEQNEEHGESADGEAEPSSEHEACRVYACGVIGSDCECLARMGGRPAYSITTGCLLPHYFCSETPSGDDATSPDTPIFECNERCGCGDDCPTRIVQKGIRVPLEIAPSSGKGLCVRTLSAICQGQFISEYVGEVIKTEEAQRRFREEYDNAGLNYLLVVREFLPSKGATLRTNVDGTRYGNVSRFFNHSCDPNMHLFLVRVSSIIPRLAFFASRDIPAGEELTFDYGHGQAATPQEDATSESGKKKPQKPCLCGSSNCRGFLPFDSFV